jgi:hypothetical protein
MSDVLQRGLVSVVSFIESHFGNLLDLSLPLFFVRFRLCDVWEVNFYLSKRYGSVLPVFCRRGLYWYFYIVSYVLS